MFVKLGVSNARQRQWSKNIISGNNYFGHRKEKVTGQWMKLYDRLQDLCF
jgi:hypothetical protein